MRWPGVASSTRSARPSWKWRQLSVPGPVDLDRVVGVLDGHDPPAAPHELGLASATVSVVFPEFFRPTMEMIRVVATGRSALARSSAVFTLKNRSSGSPKRRTSARGRIPMVDALVEADGAKIAGCRGWLRWRNDSPGRTRRREARRRAGPRFPGCIASKPPSPAASVGDQGLAERTACPRRGRRRARAPRRPRYRCLRARPCRACGSFTTRRSGRQEGASGLFATSNGGAPSAAVIVRTSRSRIRSPTDLLQPLRPPARTGVRRRPPRIAPRISICRPRFALEDDVESDLNAEEVLVDRLVGRDQVRSASLLR